MQKNPDRKKEYKENKERRLKPKDKKIFIIEYMYTEKSYFGYNTKWWVWNRYKTEKQRDQAYENLRNKKETYIMFRKGKP